MNPEEEKLQKMMKAFASPERYPDEPEIDLISRVHQERERAMSNELPPLPSDWYDTLPEWKQNLLHLLSWVLGDMIAMHIVGYWRFLKKWNKDQ